MSPKARIAIVVTCLAGCASSNPSNGRGEAAADPRALSDGSTGTAEAASIDQGGNTPDNHDLVDGGLGCRWPASFDDAGDCHAARASVTCFYDAATSIGGWSGCGCLSSDPTICPGCPPRGSCHDECPSSEYAVECSFYHSPPSPCHFLNASPGGMAFFCCPCE